MEEKTPIRILDAPDKDESYDGEMLLLAGDCTLKAYDAVYKVFHKDKLTFLGCPKWDEEAYAKKLTAILKNNRVKRITVLRLDAECCDGFEEAMSNAIVASGSICPWHAISMPANDDVKAVCEQLAKTR